MRPLENQNTAQHGYIRADEHLERNSLAAAAAAADKYSSSSSIRHARVDVRA